MYGSFQKSRFGNGWKLAGWEKAFKTILASDPDALQDWNDAITLDDNDPKVEAICGMFVSQELLTLEDITLMKEECLSPYQE